MFDWQFPINSGTQKDEEIEREIQIKKRERIRKKARERDSHAPLQSTKPVTFHYGVAAQII